MIKGINHLGIVVENIEEMITFLNESFEAEEIKRIEVPQMQQISSLVKIGNDCLELMEPTSPDGPAGRFLESKGGGLHHISILCDDLEETCVRLEKKGVQLMSKIINEDFRVAFIHPKSGKGILYEITDQISIDRVTN